MALNRQILQGSWNELKGKIREHWADLTDDDLQGARGSVDRLVGLIQRKTGETRADIQTFLDGMTEDGASVIGDTAETVRDYLHSAAETVRGSAHEAIESVREGYESTEKMVHRRPMESLAVCFGAGLIAGVVVALAMRPRT